MRVIAISERNIMDSVEKQHLASVCLAELSRKYRDVGVGTLTQRRGGTKAPRCIGMHFLRDETDEDCKTCPFERKCEAVIQKRSRISDLAGIPRQPIDPSKFYLRKEYLRWHQSDTRKRKLADLEYRRASRAGPGAAIESEGAHRLKALKRATAARLQGKRLEQLRGRENEVTDAWRAKAYALVRYGQHVTDAKVANIFEELRPGRSYTRHQARSDRALIEKLEMAPHVWGAFKQVPGS
jgi:hypothetical protein